MTLSSPFSPTPAANVGDYQDPPQSVQNQASHSVSNFVDGSGPIFSMYMEMATEEDKKMADNWKADADGILIFTGLFSAAVASLISVSIQDIRPNPQDTSNFYLANIYQTIADPNRSNISSSLPTPTPLVFSPPNSAVWVNALWFLSLVISLTCALLATLLQQWARRYLKVTQSRYSPHKRARIRAFFAEGVDKFLLPWAVETLPALLHISLFLFFAGLVVFLCNVDITIFKLVLSWVSVCTALYGCITFMPIFRHDSPYYTSLSSSVWLIVFGIAYVGSQVRLWFYWSVRLRRLVFWRFGSRFYKMLLQGMRRTAEETALNSRSEIDARAFIWTFDCLDEDHELERFFSSVPGFRNSKVVEDPLPSLTEEGKERLSGGLIGFLDRTLSSDLLPEPVKRRRAMICAKAIDPAHIPKAFNVLDRILSNYQDSGPLATEIAQVVRGWDNDGGENTILVAQATVSSIVARAQCRNDSWFILASDELGVPESVLRDYATNGDSLSLAILIHVTRQQFSHFREQSWPWIAFSSVLDIASKSNVQDTSPKLQHEFCALWNQIVQQVQNGNDRWMAFDILGRIRNIYVDLHQDTDSALTRFSPSTGDRDGLLFDPFSYPVCNVPGHIHWDSASTTFSRTVLHDNVALPPASLASHDAPSLSVPVPLHVVESPTDVPPLDSFRPPHQTTIESLRIPDTSPDTATAGAIRDIVTLGITMPHPTPETSISFPSLSSTSPPAAVALQLNLDLLTPSDPPNLPSSNPVLDNIPPGSPLSSRPPMTRSDLSPSFPESDRSTIVTTAPCAFPGPTPPPDFGAAAEDDGIPRPDLRKENDPPSVNRAIQANTLDLPPQSPSLPSVTDSNIAIAGPSLREAYTKRTGVQRSSSASFA